jgi:hypothetical protein
MFFTSNACYLKTRLHNVSHLKVSQGNNDARRSYDIGAYLLLASTILITPVAAYFIPTGCCMVAGDGVVTDVLNVSNVSNVYK